MQKVAILKLNLSGSNVDRENGIVKGCVLAQVGRVARFAGIDGKLREISITPSLISGLLALWTQAERGDAHWTHDWVTSQDDALKSRVATWRNFRKDDSGNLIADAFLWPSAHKEAILYAAENDPKGMMISQVFTYTGGKDTAVASEVRAADFVGLGACTEALLSKFSFNQNDNTMDKTALLEMLKDDEVKTALLSLLPETKATETALLKSAEDKATALFNEKKAEILAEAKAEAAKDFEANKVALLKEAEAAVVKNIGSGSFLKDFGKKDADDAEAFITAQLSAGCPNRATAISRMAKDKPDLYATFRS